MQARMIRENNIVIVHLSGRVDVETAVPFRQACLSRLGGNRVVFDFKDLSFVGSSGILPFLETMQSFNDKNPGSTKFSSVGTEFRKVFAATPLCVIEIYETASAAVNAFLNPQVVVAAPIAAAPTTVPQATHDEAEAPTEPQAYLSFRDEPEDVPGTDDGDDETYA